MNISQPIFTQRKYQRLYGKMVSILYKMGEKYCCDFFLMELEPFSYYFVLTKTLSRIKDKWNLVHLNKISPRKIPQALRDQDIHPIQDMVFWNNLQIFLDVETIFTLLGFQVVLFCIVYQFSLLLLDLSQ